MREKNIAIIGCGKMGGIILNSIKKNLKECKVTGVEKREKQRFEIKEKSDIKVFEYIKDAGTCDVYIIAVKPQDIDNALGELGEVIKESNSRILVVSIAAGITVKYITDYLKVYNPDISVIRVMPNTGAEVSESMSAIAVSGKVDKDDMELVERIFKGMGVTVKVRKEFLDAVTALSGSGPAYFFYMAEVMEKFANDMGMDKVVARKVVSQTIKGAGELMLKSDKSFEQLRYEVTSPGGTTQAAMEYLESKSFKEIFYEALNKAKMRSEELSGKRT